MSLQLPKLAFTFAKAPFCQTSGLQDAIWWKKPPFDKVLADCVILHTKTLCRKRLLHYRNQ